MYYLSWFRNIEGIDMLSIIFKKKKHMCIIRISDLICLRVPVRSFGWIWLPGQASCYASSSVFFVVVAGFIPQVENSSRGKSRCRIFWTAGCV